MNKILLLDLDGVILKNEMFSDVYSREVGINSEVMMPFFTEKKKLANLGQADMKLQLEDEIVNWNWGKSVDDLLEFWFESDTKPDKEFVSICKNLESVDIYLASDQEKYRTNYVWNIQGLKDWMKGRFVSFEMGLTKSQAEYWDHVIKKLGTNPKDIIFFDDSQSKVDAALAAGINAFLFTDNESFRERVEELF